MSLITISNGTLSVTADSCGAVLHSIVRDGAEYLWQGDKRYWARRDANLFPYVGRLTDGVYTYNGARYSLPTHGFCIGREFETVSRSEDSVSFVLRSSAETLGMYPFPFEFSIEYSLAGGTLRKACAVRNMGDAAMHFGIGSHPGFNVPVAGEGGFEDWYLEFSPECSPGRVELDPANYRITGAVTDYPLECGSRIPLRHGLFDNDAVVLSGASRDVTLKSAVSSRRVRVSFPDMPFVGFWHAPRTDAPYVCVEPWVSLPSHSAYVEDITLQEHIIHLDPGGVYTNVILIEIG